MFTLQWIPLGSLMAAPVEPPQPRKMSPSFSLKHLQQAVTIRSDVLMSALSHSDLFKLFLLGVF